MLIGQGVTGVAVRKIIRNLFYPAAASTTGTSTIASVDENKAFVLVEQNCDADDISSRVRVKIENATTLRWNRQASTTNIECKCRVVEFY